MRNFTDFERLSLAIQFTLLEKVDPNGGWEKFKQILSRGYTREYPNVWKSLDVEVEESDCAFVVDVLTMFEAIQRPILDDPKKPRMPSARMCPGFDGDGEPQLLGYFSYLVEGAGSWTNLIFTMPDKNSPTPTRSMYSRMLAQWAQCGKKSNLSPAEIAAILAERIHPENRAPLKPKS